MTKHMLERAAADGRGFVAEVSKLWKQHSLCKIDFAVSFMLVLPFLSCLLPSSGNRLFERECCVRMRLKNKVFSKSVKPQVDRNKQMWNKTGNGSLWFTSKLWLMYWHIQESRGGEDACTECFRYNEKILLQVSALYLVFPTGFIPHQFLALDIYSVVRYYIKKIHQYFLQGFSTTPASVSAIELYSHFANLMPTQLVYHFSLDYCS